MSETATVLVQSVELKEGVSQSGKAYKRVVLTDGNGNFASSFDAGMFQKAKPFEGQTAIIETQPNGKFTDLLDIKEAPKDAKELLGTGDYVKGQTAPSDARRILGCVAWEQAARLADVEMRHTVGREITPAMVLEAAQQYANQIFMDLLRKGRMMEDSDIPL